jgi:CRP-like cAMP-binding protein
MLSSKNKAGANVQAKAAALLITEGALVELSAADAREVVHHMQPQLVRAGQVLMREGEERHSDFMALVLDGEVTVENTVASEHDSMVVSVLGPGSLIGAMGILDGRARSATCVAATDLALAILTRDAMTDLIEQRPKVAARLLMAMSKRISDHLRETNRKVRAFAQVGKAMQQELEAAHAINRKLLEEIAALKSSAGVPAAGAPHHSRSIVP